MRFVCRHYRNHPDNLFAQNHCLQLSTFNLIIVPRTTNVDTYFVFGPCLWRKESSKRCLCLSWWWDTHITTLMRHSDGGTWSCMKKIFQPYHFLWNRIWFGPNASNSTHDWGSTKFQAFIKPYILKGGDRLVGHTKVQQFRFYIRDDGLPAMQFKLLCTTPNWGPDESILIWRQDKDGNVSSRMGNQSLANPTPWRIGRNV